LALEELGVRQLVDVFLKRKIDISSRVPDRAALDHGADLLPRHSRAQPRLDLGVAEVKEVARVVPDEAGLDDGAAVAARLGLALEDEHAGTRVALADRIRERQPGYAGADHDEVRAVGGCGHPPIRASSLVKMRRAIAAAQP
jgi:hypothetical protein